MQDTPNPSYGNFVKYILRMILWNIPRKRQSEVSDLVKSGIEWIEDRLFLYCSETWSDRISKSCGYFRTVYVRYRKLSRLSWFSLRRIRTMNMIERVNAGIKQRTKVIGALSCCESFLRLVGSILMEPTGRRYLPYIHREYATLILTER